MKETSGKESVSAKTIDELEFQCVEMVECYRPKAELQFILGYCSPAK